MISNYFSNELISFSSVVSYFHIDQPYIVFIVVFDIDYWPHHSDIIVF